MDLFPIEVNFVNLCAVCLIFTDREGNTVNAVLTVVLHVFVYWVLPVWVANEGLPADVDLRRVRVVWQALLAGLNRATLG